MRIKGFLLFILAGSFSVGPAAAASHFVVQSAAHRGGFTIPHIVHGAALRANRTFGVGGIGAYDTSVAGALSPDDSTGVLPPPPYPPVVYYPATYAPQTHCVRPKIIYLTDEKPTRAPVRIIYGMAPTQCSE